MCHILGGCAASMAVGNGSAGIAGALLLYTDDNASRPEAVLYEYAAHVKLSNIHDAEACAVVYLAELMGRKYVHRQIRKYPGGLRGAVLWSDRQSNKAGNYWRFKEITQEYRRCYGLSLEVKWEEKRSAFIKRFHDDARRARNLPIGMGCFYNDEETHQREFSWAFGDKTVVQLFMEQKA